MTKKPNYSEAWNFGPPIDREQFTVKTMLENLSTEWKIQESIIVEATDEKLHEEKFLNIDSSKAKKVLGWKSVYSLKESISETSSWYKLFSENEDEIKDYSIKQIHDYENKGKQLNLPWAE